MIDESIQRRAGAVLLGILLASPVTLAQSARSDRALPESVSASKLAEPMTAKGEPQPGRTVVEAGLLTAKGKQEIVVRLTKLSVAETGGNGSQKAIIEAQQNSFIERSKKIDKQAKVLSTTQVALNAVVLEVDASAIPQIADDPAVARISRVKNYEMDLSETVPYIGASTVQGGGIDGTGVKVAVLDSGIDYYHVAFGGSGDPADYNADNPNVIEPGSFPTAKVVGGTDFVGSVWPSGPLAPDPDPLDDGPQAGHGTHVGDIVGGITPGIPGVAPGASLYAVKVCSSVSTSCSGIALINGMDFALDPNDDGQIDDRVDIINMSLGSVYGQAFDDDLSQAVENASAAGVLTVASAGNSADKPYVTGSPAAASTALSVAQTEVPSAFQPLMEIVSPASIAGNYAAVFQPWSEPLNSVIQAPVQYGDGSGGNLNGCAAFAPGSLAGLIVLVDRGACNFTLKIKNIGDAGGLIGIIGLVAPGAPFAGGDGGDGPITIPGYMISQADSNTIKSELGNGVVAKFDPNEGISLVQHMVGSSSRGPTMLSNRIKPEIGAPGASVSAIAGSGDDTGPFGGTSGAAPMVSGSAALLKQAFPNRSPAEIKAVLMNTAETDIQNTPEFFGGDLAPITRIGGGEVRVDQAVNSSAAAWDAQNQSGALSFNFRDVSKNNETHTRKVTVRNYTGAGILYDVSSSFRFADDQANGAVTVNTPSSVFVPPNGDTQFQVVLHLDGSELRDWGMNSGSLGANGDVLTTFEYDGYIDLVDANGGADPIHLPWHVLPRKAGDVRIKNTTVAPNGTTKVRNNGAGATLVESYSLLGSNGDLPEGAAGEQNPTPDFRHIGYATFPVPAGFCGPNDSFVMAFAVNTWERQTHADAPAVFEFDLDTNQDGTLDYAVFNFDLSFTSLSDGRNVTWVQNLATGSASAFFFTDHQTNSGNTVLFFCGDQIGMNASNFGQPIDMQALAVDFYFTGTVTDAFAGITISPLGERYLGVFANGGVGSSNIPSHDSDNLQVIDFGPGTNNTETGLLLLYRDGAPVDNEAGTVLVSP